MPRLWPLLALALLASACGVAATQPTAEPTPSATPVEIAPSATATASEGQRPEAKRAAAPSGYVEVTVEGVAPAKRGHAVVLMDLKKQIMLPIFVAKAEALSIHLRRDKKRFVRPLTHDLLDDVLRRIGAELVKVQIDDIRGKTFVGAIFVRSGGKLFEIDARPSDAIALAIGNRVPIFVAERVLERAGLKKPEDQTGPHPAGGPTQI